MEKHFITIISMLMMLVAATVAQKPQNFTMTCVMGDSLVDIGNNNDLDNFYTFYSIAIADHLPYGRLVNSIGRFTDGCTLPDLIAERIGIAPPYAYLDPRTSSCSNLYRGTNVASGGAGLVDSNSAILTPYNLTEQLRWLKIYVQQLRNCQKNATATSSMISGALICIFIGPNDFSLKTFNPQVASLSNSDYQNLLLNNLRGRIRDIYDLGFRNFFIPNLPPLGCTPIAKTLNCSSSSDPTCRQRCNEDTNNLAKSYNKGLVNMTNNLPATLPGIKIYIGNSYDFTYDVIKNPSAYGISVPDRGCCGTGFFEIGDGCDANYMPVCPDASRYIFFDAVHPTCSFTKKLFLNSTVPLLKI